MKSETVTIQVQRFTDDDGEPVCVNGCLLYDANIGNCQYSNIESHCMRELRQGNCPIWHNAVKPKWANFDDWWASIPDHERNSVCIRYYDVWDAARQ